MGDENNNSYGNSSAIAPHQTIDQQPRALVDDLIKTIIRPQSQLITAHLDESNYSL